MKSASELQIRVLGPFEMLRAGKPVRLPRKAQALLAHLAVSRGKPIAKDMLATLLWGHSGTEQAQASLRQSLVALRAALGAQAELLVADQATLMLSDSSALAVDAQEFLSLSGSGDLADLQKADAIYRDAFLAGMTIPVDTFERWLAIERQRFEAERLDLLHRLAAGHAVAGESHEAMAACRRLLSLDPLFEEGHRLLMTLLANSGNRGAALLQYEQCAETIRGELGVEPDAETVKLAEAIRLGVLQETRHSLPSTVPGERQAPATPASAAAAGLSLPDKPSVAVMPFVNLSGDANQDYFVRGLVEDITVALGREKWLFVIASPSAFAAEDGGLDARRVGAALGVHYVLKGSARMDGGELLFVVQLIDATRGTHVWSGRFQDRMDNLFAMQDRLVTKVAATIAPALMSAEVERALHQPTDSLTAFDLYLRALPLFRAGQQANEGALALLGQAIAIDPSFAAAHALAARCYQFQLLFGWRSPGDPVLAAGVRHGHEAASKGRNDSEALWMAGLALAHLSGELDFAQALIERSLTLNPNSANAWIGSCLLHSYLGNSDTAITHFERAQRLNPLDLSQHLHWNMLAWAHLGAGRYEEAAQAADRTLSVQPDYPAGLRLKAVTYGLLGRTDEARATAGRLLARQPSTTIAWLRVFLQPMLQRNPKALEAYLAGARAAGVPEGT